MNEINLLMYVHIVNAAVLLLAIIGTILLIKKLKFSDRNNKLLFILYILYWISPLLCRDYFECVHVHLHTGDNGLLMWVPIVAYGVISLFWRPLNDFLTYRLKSRKTVIYISLAVQMFCLIPFLVYPTFTTNVIEAAGAGVGAAGIGLFNLMFNENESVQKKRFLSVSMFALPPIISGIMVAPVETFIAAMVPSIHTSYMYMDVIWYMFFIALIAIIASVILASFVSERKESLFQHDKYKTPIQTGKQKWSFALVCLAGACALFIKWATAGSFATLQLSYISIYDGLFRHDTTVIEGYLGLMYSIGALISTIIAGKWLNRTKNEPRTQMLLMILSAFTSVIYLGLTCSFINTWSFFFLNIVNGLAYGFMWNVLIGITLDKVFVKTNKVTPIGIFNSSLSIGVITGSVLVGYWKSDIFNMHGGWSVYTYRDFRLETYFVNLICICVAVLMILSYVISYYLYKGTSHKKVKVSKQFVSQSDSEV